MSNQDADTKPERGSYEEFHASVLNQIRRWDEASEHQVNLASPMLQKALANDIAGNLWVYVLLGRAGNGARELLYGQLIDTVRDLLPLLNTAEVLGEWEALDINHHRGATEREKLIAGVEAARAVLDVAVKEGY